jgi:hypothetical protein
VVAENGNGRLRHEEEQRDTDAPPQATLLEGQGPVEQVPVEEFFPCLWWLAGQYRYRYRYRYRSSSVRTKA